MYDPELDDSSSIHAQSLNGSTTWVQEFYSNSCLLPEFKEWVNEYKIVN